MATRLWTPQDLPSDFKLGWYHFPDTSTVTLDANGKIASIENKFNNGSRPCSTADATKRHLLQKVNGYDTAFSDSTNYGGILMTNTSGLPVGNADLCMIFINMPQDGVVGGYRGGQNYWVDNPYPDYRMRTDKGDFTLTGTTNNSTLHTLIVNRKSGTTYFRVDGMARGSQTPATPYNTTLGTFGIKGADAAYYVQKGASLGAIIGKRAATADEMYLIEKWYSTYTGQTVQSDNPYINGLPMVDDGTGPVVGKGDASITLGSIGLTSNATVVVQAASSTTLGNITMFSTGGVAGPAIANITLDSIGLSSTGTVIARADSATTLGSIGLTSTASARATANLAITLDPIQAGSAAINVVRANASNTLGNIGLSAAAAGAFAPINANSSTTLGMIGITTAGTSPVRADASITLGNITMSSSGQRVITAVAAGTLGNVTLAANAVTRASGTLTVTLGSIGLSSNGAIVLPPPSTPIVANTGKPFWSDPFWDRANFWDGPSGIVLGNIGLSATFRRYIPTVTPASRRASVPTGANRSVKAESSSRRATVTVGPSRRVAVVPGASRSASA